MARDSWGAPEDIVLFVLLTLAGVLFGGAGAYVVPLGSDMYLADRPGLLAAVVGLSTLSATLLVALRRYGLLPTVYSSRPAGPDVWDDLYLFEMVVFVAVLGTAAVLGAAAVLVLLVLLLLLLVGVLQDPNVVPSSDVPEQVLLTALVLAPILGVAVVTLCRRGALDVPSSFTAGGWGLRDDCTFAFLTAQLLLLYAQPLAASMPLPVSVGLVACGPAAVVLRRRGVFARRDDAGPAST